MGDLLRDLAGIRRHLRPGDRIVSATEVQHDVPRRSPSTLRALLALGGVQRSAQLGSTGPLNAATTVGDAADAPPELHLFETVFARDALWVVHFLGTHFTSLRCATVMKLAESQGVMTDSTREEQPGRIAHELRTATDPIALELTQRSGWGWPYYGAVDTTPLFVNCVASAVMEDGPGILELSYIARTGERRLVADAISQAVNWLARRQDEDPDGLISFQRSNPGGIENQFWRDSWDALSHADGTLANHAAPIAALHVQAVAYEALLHGVWLVGDSRGRKAGELRARAASLKESVFRRFWIEQGDRSFPAVAVDYHPDGGRRALAIRTSDMGHLLTSRLLDGTEDRVCWWRDCIVRNLQESTMLCTAGLRSLDSCEQRFWEGGYHTGSCWLWDTMLVAEGLRRHGLVDAALDLEQRCWRVCHRYGLLPEFARGAAGAEPVLTRHVVDVWQAADQRLNRLEQPPQEIQAWTAAALYAAKRRHGRQVLGRSVERAPGQPTTD